MLLIYGWRRRPERVSRHVQETMAARGSLAVACEDAGTRAGPSPLCQADDMRKYVIMGIQGSGKGTQAKMLAADLDLVHISVGDIFRWNVQNHTKLGAQVRRVMAAGELVGDDLVQSVVRDRLSRDHWNFKLHHRRVPASLQLSFLESYDIDGVIESDLPDSEVRRRVLNGRLCGDCGLDYNLIANSPTVPGRCDMCGGELITREDDTEGRSRSGCGTITTRPTPSWRLPAQGVRLHRGRAARVIHRASQARTARIARGQHGGGPAGRGPPSRRRARTGAVAAGGGWANRRPSRS